MAARWEKLVLRAASGSLTAAETATAAFPGTGVYNEALFVLNISTLTTDATKEVDFFFQTTYNGGANWHDLAQKHYDSAEDGTTPVDLISYVEPGSSKINFTTTDGTMGDDTVSTQLPLGEGFRIKTVITSTPTYNYACHVFLRESGTSGRDVAAAEDVAHVSGDLGYPALAVRQDTLAALAGTTADYTPLQVNASGALYVVDTTGDISYAEDSAHVSADLGVMTLAVRQDTAAALAATDNDYIPLTTDSTGRLRVAALPANSGVDIGDVDVLSIAAGDNNIGNVDVLSIAAGTNNIGDVDVLSIAAGTNNIGDVDVLTIAAGDNNIGNVDVVTLPALVAGTANIGDVDVLTIAAGDNNIGNVDVVTLPALVAGTANIGDVDVLTIAAGTTRIGGAYQVTGHIIDEDGDANVFKRALANIAASTTDGAVVTGVASKILRIHQASIHTAATATNVTFNTKPAGSGTAISHLMACGANGGEVLPYSPMGWFDCTVSDGLTVTTGAGSTTGILVGYTEV